MRSEGIFAGLAAVLVALTLTGALPSARAATPGAECEAAATAAEREYALPPGLLAAIGRSESGRLDPDDGRVHPWPWTLDVAGRGRFFASAAAAVMATEAALAQGMRTVDVGCFQIDLLFHPLAFPTLAVAFDALANARAAARFLAALHARAGEWGSALALYHSGAPERGEPYRGRVMADWQGQSGVSAPPPPADPFVFRLTPTLRPVRVISPDPASPSAQIPIAGDSRLPRVIMPRDTTP